MNRLYFDPEQHAERLRVDPEWNRLMAGKDVVILDEVQSWLAGDAYGVVNVLPAPGTVLTRATSVLLDCSEKGFWGDLKPVT